MKDKNSRTPTRDMHPSGIAKVLELFFAGNPNVEAAVLFDRSGEAVDYHSYIDPFEARLLAAHNGIIFGMTQYKLKWLEDAAVSMIEIETEKRIMITTPVIEDFYLIVSLTTMDINDNSDLTDTINGAVEALCQEIG